MQIYFGARVLCQDGRAAGNVMRIVMDQETREVSHIVVGKSDLLPREFPVPLNMVESSDEQSIALYSNREGVAEMARQQLPIIVQPAASSPAQSIPPVATEREPAPEHKAMAVRHVSLLLGNDTLVRAIDGRAGVLVGVRLDLYADQLASIVVQRPGKTNRRLTIPVDWISEIDQQGIKLATTLENIEKLVGPEAGPYISVERHDAGDKEIQK